MKEDWTQHRLPPVVRSRVQGATGHDPWSQENESLFAEVLFQRRPDRPAAVCGRRTVLISVGLTPGDS